MRVLLLSTLLTWPLLGWPLATAHGEEEHFPPGAADRALVTIEREAGSADGLVEVQLPPAVNWRGDLFISLSKGKFHERKGIRRDASGRYRLEARLPESGEWNIYLRYGPGQAGMAGYGRIRLVEAAGGASTTIRLDHGFRGEDPGYVQPLGFLVFTLVAALTALGLWAILQSIRASQETASLPR